MNIETHKTGSIWNAHISIKLTANDIQVLTHETKIKN